MTPTDPTAALKLARDARDLLAALLPMAEMQPADVEPGVHLMQGDCPDETQPSSRDSECPACRKMMAAQELIAAIDALPAPSGEPGDADAPILTKARELFGFVAGLGGFETAVRELAAYIRAERATPQAAPAPQAEPMTERDQFDLARWHQRLGELADAYYEAGRTNPARQRARAELMMHALDCATGWRARSAKAAQAAPAAQAEPVGVGTPEFEAWWHRHGQFIRAGGGDYEKSFAFSAWCASQPAPAVAAPAQPLTEAQTHAMWVAATIEPCTHWHCYRRGVIDGERALGITATPQEEPARTADKPVARVYRAHAGGRKRSIGWQAVELLPGATVQDGAMLYAPPQEAPAPQSLTDDRLLTLWGDRSDGPTSRQIIGYARAVLAAAGITATTAKG